MTLFSCSLQIYVEAYPEFRNNRKYRILITFGFVVNYFYQRKQKYVIELVLLTWFLHPLLLSNQTVSVADSVANKSNSVGLIIHSS